MWKYFVLYALYSAVTATLTSLPIMDRFTFNNSLIVVIKDSTLNYLILWSIIAAEKMLGLNIGFFLCFLKLLAM